jgi:beta-xylosidase
MKIYIGIFLFIASIALAGNPIGTGADPHAFLFNGTVYVYPTSYPDKFCAYTSGNLVDWNQPKAVLDVNSIKWAPNGKCPWAPCIIQKDKTFYFYYSLGPKPSSIGVAQGESPLGHFVDSGRALLSDNGEPDFEAIDPMVFKDPNSGIYYIYVGGSAGSTLNVFQLAPDMLSIDKEIKVDTPQNFTEGAFVHYRNGTYYLSYSYGRWNNSTYSVHYATSKTPIGPWQYQGAILVSDDVYKGPGHHSFLYNPAADKWYIFYHRWENVTADGPYSGARQIAIEYVEYEPDGRIKPIKMTAKGVETDKLMSVLR